MNHSPGPPRADRPRVRRCRGCEQLLIAGQTCPCDTETVHVITELGPTDGPGIRVLATMLRTTGPQGTWGPGDPTASFWEPRIADWQARWHASPHNFRFRQQ